MSEALKKHLREVGTHECPTLGTRMVAPCGLTRCRFHWDKVPMNCLHSVGPLSMEQVADLVGIDLTTAIEKYHKALSTLRLLALSTESKEAEFQTRPDLCCGCERKRPARQLANIGGQEYYWCSDSCIRVKPREVLALEILTKLDFGVLLSRLSERFSDSSEILELTPFHTAQELQHYLWENYGFGPSLRMFRVPETRKYRRRKISKLEQRTLNSLASKG